MAKLRFDAVESAFAKRPVEVKEPGRPTEYFGSKVFNRVNMFKYLPADVFARMVEVMDGGAPLDSTLTEAMADGMKRWAMDNGVTHYTHWFSPLTGTTAEKVGDDVEFTVPADAANFFKVQAK